MLDLKGKYCKDCKIFNDEIEDEAFSQIYELLDNPGHNNTTIRIMPDVHKGAGCTIGFTQKLSDYVNPDHIGVDIGCSIDIRKTNIDCNDEYFKEVYPLIEYRIKKDIPFGMNINSKKLYEDKVLYRYLNLEYNKAKSAWPDMINDIPHSEIGEQYISKMLKRIGMDEGVFYKSLGSVGSGNHFIEIGNWDGKLAFTIHCGSRNFGVKVCKYWEKIASSSQIDKKLLKEEEKKIRETTKDRHQIKDLINKLHEEFKLKAGPNGYLSGENMKGYITDMVIVTAYAQFNHRIITEQILKILNQSFPNVKIIDYVGSIHNYIDFQDHIIRKGSIRSYEGERMVVPFNMRDGLAICDGKSNPDWNYSCAHGAGRKMSRNKAKSSLSLDVFKDEMKNICTTSVCESTLDESPMAYKDTDTIINLLEPTCNIITMVKPIINIKDS